MTFKHISSAQTGAPVLSGTAGSLIGVLDAVLKDGFGLKTADSVTVTANVATITISTGHSFVAGSTALVAGATPAALNGDKIITSVTATTAAFAAPGVADGAATGGITVRVSPLGLAKPFSATNTAAYKLTDALSTGMYLRIDDAQALGGAVAGYEAMTDAATGTGRFPVVSGQPAIFWPKSQASDSSARSWNVIGDARGFYVALLAANNGVAFVAYFGDLDSLRSGDAYACALSGADAVNHASNGGSEYGQLALSDPTLGSASVFLPRAPNALGGSVRCYQVTDAFCAANTYSGNAGPIYPNHANGGLVLAPVALRRADGDLRGYLPGLYHCPQTLGSTFAHETLITGTGALSGHRLLALRTGRLSGGGNVGSTFIDLDHVRA